MFFGIQGIYKDDCEFLESCINGYFYDVWVLIPTLRPEILHFQPRNIQNSWQKKQRELNEFDVLFVLFLFYNTLKSAINSIVNFQKYMIAPFLLMQLRQSTSSTSPKKQHHSHRIAFESIPFEVITQYQTILPDLKSKVEF